MNNRCLSQTQGVFLLFAVMSGDAILMGNMCNGTRDSWISILIAGAAMIPVVFLYSRLLYLFPGMDIFSILERGFGRVAGLVFSSLLVLYALVEGSFSLRVFAEFIHITSLHLTPPKAVMVAVIVVCLYLGRSGTGTLGRWAMVTAPVVLGILSLSILMSSSELDFTNFLPVMDGNLGNVMRGTAFKLMYPFGEWVMLLCVLQKLRPGASASKAFLYAVGIGTLLLLTTFARNLSLLGEDVFSQVYFPCYYSSKASNVSTTFGRMEFLVFLAVIISFMSKMTISLIFACRGLGQILRLENGARLMSPVAALMMGVGIMAANGITQMKTLLPQTVPYYAPLVQFGIPLLCWIVVECRKKSLSPVVALAGGEER